MINGLEKPDPDRFFFSSSYTNVRLSLLVGGAGPWCHSTSSAQSTANLRPSQEFPPRKGAESLEDIQKALEKEMKLS